MLNGSLRRGIRHRELAISWWQRLGPVTFGMLVTGLILLLILLYAGVITVAP
jgi:hypothetical protein